MRRAILSREKKMYTLTSIVVKVTRSVVMLITTDASSIAATWAATWTTSRTTRWIATWTMSATVATRTASRTWVYNCIHIVNSKFYRCLNLRILHDRLLRVRLCERDRYDGGSGGFSDTSVCSARRKLPIEIRIKWFENLLKKFLLLKKKTCKFSYRIYQEPMGQLVDVVAFAFACWFRISMDTKLLDVTEHHKVFALEYSTVLLDRHPHLGMHTWKLMLLFC